MKKRPDIGIGYRAAAEVRRLFPKRRHAIAAIGCGRNLLYEWECGMAPSALYLARLHAVGADVIWILTGKRGGYGMNETIQNHRYNPCKGCPDRYPACSDHCQKPEHLKWKAERETIRENRRKHKSPVWASAEPYDRRRK